MVHDTSASPKNNNVISSENQLKSVTKVRSTNNVPLFAHTHVCVQRDTPASPKKNNALLKPVERPGLQRDHKPRVTPNNTTLIYAKDHTLKSLRAEDASCINI